MRIPSATAAGLVFYNRVLYGLKFIPLLMIRASQVASYYGNVKVKSDWKILALEQGTCSRMRAEKTKRGQHSMFLFSSSTQRLKKLVLKPH